MPVDHDPAPSWNSRRLIHLGFACNNRCVFCAQGDARRSTPPPTRAQIEEELAEVGGGAIAFVGGEPTVRDDLPALVARARELGIDSILLQTNGRRLAYASYARQLRTSGLDRVEIAVHGATEALHDYHTASPGSARHSLAGIRAAGDAGISVSVTTVVTRSSYRHLVELVERLAPLGVEALHCATARAHGRAADAFDRVIPRLTALAPHLRQAARRARRLGLALVSSGVPLCLLDGVEAIALELHAVTLPPLGNILGPPCDDCSLASICPGIDKAYATRFGFDELEPRSNDTSPRIRDEARRHRDDCQRFAGLGTVQPRPDAVRAAADMMG